MNNWVIFALAVSQIVVLYGISVRSCLGAINKVFLDKNIAWVNENPAFSARFAQPTYTAFIMYALGAVWLLALFKTFDAMDDTTLFFYTMMPNFVWQVVLMIYLIVAKLRIARHIPLPSKRSASLVRRNLGDYVHPAWTVMCGACYLFVIGAYIVALTNQHFELAVFGARMLFVCLVLLITVVFFRYSLRRKKNFLDEAFGAAFRRWEVIANFGFSMLGGAVVVLWVMINDLTTTMWASQLSLAVAFGVVTQSLLIYLSLNSRFKQAMTTNLPAALNI